VAEWSNLVSTRATRLRALTRRRAALCEEAIRTFAPLTLLRLFPSRVRRSGGLAALLMLQHPARLPAFDSARGASHCSRDQSSRSEPPADLPRGWALLDQAVRHGLPASYQVQARSPAACPASRAEHDWTAMICSTARWSACSPRRCFSQSLYLTVAKIRGPAEALARSSRLRASSAATSTSTAGARRHSALQLLPAPRVSGAFYRASRLPISAEAAHSRSTAIGWQRRGPLTGGPS